MTASLRSRHLKRCAAASGALLLSLCAGTAPVHADLPPYVHVVGIAFVGALSGDQRDYGIQLSNGMNLAIDETNERRGLADFAFVFHSFDDQSDPGVAQQEAEFALVDQQTSLVVGHVGGQETALAERVYNEKGVPLIIPTSPLGVLTRQGYNNVFRLCPSDVTEGQQDARYAERTLKAKKAAIVYEETDYGADAGAGFLDYARAGHTLDAKDFGLTPDLKNRAATIDQVKAYAPDLLYIAGKGPDMARVLVDLRAAGIDAPALATQELFDEKAARSAGPAAQGLIVSSCVPPVNLMPTAQLFLQHYQTRYGRLTSYALMGYVAAQIAIDAATQIRNWDKAALIRQLNVGTFPTILGTYSFTHGGDVANPILYLYQFGSGGTFEYHASTYPNPLISR